MKTKYILFVLLCTLTHTFQLVAQHTIPSKVKGGFRACIAITSRDVRITTNTYKFIQTKKVAEYDDNGNSFLETVYNFKDSIESKTYYKRDSLGKILAEIKFNSLGGFIREDLYKYDTFGNKIEWSTRDSSGSLRGKQIWEYDQQGKLFLDYGFRSQYGNTDSTIYRFDTISHKKVVKMRQSNSTTCFFTYNENGDRIEMRIYDNLKNILEDKMVSCYDNRGNLLEDLWYKNDTSLYITYKYKYDDDNNQIEYYAFQKDSKNDSKTTYKFDNRKNIIEKVEYNNSGEIEDMYRYIYNQKLNKLEYGLSIRNNKVYLNESHIFDDEGNEISSSYNTRPTIINRMYDKWNNLTEEVKCDPINPTVTTKFIYLK
jgi:hypothetical protein